MAPSESRGRKRLARTGLRVSDRTIEPASAMVTVRAIGNRADGDVFVVRPESFGNLLERQSVLEQPVSVESHLILLFVAAPTIDFGNTAHRSQLRFDDPIVNRSQFGQSLDTLLLGHFRFAITDGVGRSADAGQQRPTAIETPKRGARLARFADPNERGAVRRHAGRKHSTNPASQGTAVPSPATTECRPENCDCSIPA